jgi:hypothetical protein
MAPQRAVSHGLVLPAAVRALPAASRTCVTGMHIQGRAARAAAHLYVVDKALRLSLRLIHPVDLRDALNLKRCMGEQTTRPGGGQPDFAGWSGYDQLAVLETVRASGWSGFERTRSACDHRDVRERLSLRPALREATPFPLDPEMIEGCLDEDRDRFDVLFRRAHAVGLAGLARGDRSGHLWRVVGEVAESIAARLLGKLGYSVFWHNAEPGIHGVDLLLLSPDEAILALEVKGTLRAGAIPRLTPSRLRQMSRDWLNRPDNPAMIEWELEADDIYTGVMVVDLATPAFRVALSANFETYAPVLERAGLETIRRLDGCTNC